METKLWRTLGKAYYGGKDDEENRVSYLLFSLVKIPGKTRGLDIFKPLSHILTKKDSYQTWLASKHARSFFLRSLNWTAHSYLSLCQCRFWHFVFCFPLAQEPLLLYDVVSVVQDACVISRCPWGFNSPVCHVQVCLHLWWIFIFHLLVLVIKLLRETGNASRSRKIPEKESRYCVVQLRLLLASCLDLQVFYRRSY